MSADAPETGKSTKNVSIQKLLAEDESVNKSEYDQLLAQLNAEGIDTIRDDSRLVHAFLQGKLSAQWTRDRVVQELCTTFFLYNYTEYPQYSKNILPLLAKYCHEKAGMPYHVAWNHVHKYMVPQFKYVAIERAGGTPSKWPWKKSE